MNAQHSSLRESFQKLENLVSLHTLPRLGVGAADHSSPETAGGSSLRWPSLCWKRGPRR
jgi:hypothetical protein